jgi:hypothetical protein
MAGGAVCFLTPIDANMLSFLTDFNNIIKFNNFTDFYAKLKRLEINETMYNSISLQALSVATRFTWENYAVKVYNEITRI